MKLRVLRTFGDAAGVREPGEVYEETAPVAAIRIAQGLVVAVKDGPEAAVINTDTAERAVMAVPVKKAPMRRHIDKKKR